MIYDGFYYKIKVVVKFNIIVTRICLAIWAKCFYWTTVNGPATGVYIFLHFLKNKLIYKLPSISAGSFLLTNFNLGEVIMEFLKERILKDGQVLSDNILKVDSFINHQIDIDLFNEIGKEFKKRFDGLLITKILTIEASGIGIACIAAQYFKVPVVFAKKHDAINIDKETYETDVFSFTKNRTYKVRVSKKYINPDDKILIIDDFLANGNAVVGLVDIVNQGGAEVLGVGIVIEKGFQAGREVIEKKGIRVESLAIINSLKNGQVVFK